jgi:predicted HNH restriction endonuclease
MSIQEELLREQVNRLINELKKAEAENARLKEQVERLTKAGDLMANRLMYQGYHLTIPQWNEAKDKYPRR